MNTMPQSFDDTRKALSYIASEYGVDVLLGKKISIYFADITLNQLKVENKLIKMLTDEGALDCLKSAIGMPDSEHEFAIRRAVARLPFAKAEGEDMLRNFAAALGWNVTQKKSSPSSHPTTSLPATPPPKPSVIAQPKVKSIPVAVPVAPRVVNGNYEALRFGSYNWRVLETDGNSKLIITENIITQMAFRVDYRKGNKWEESDIYRYLNGEFLGKFSDKEKQKIVPQAHGNIFLLSVEEVDVLFKDDTDRVETYNKSACCWWLRSPGDYSRNAAYVDIDGYVYVGGDFYAIDVFGGVRPALWLNL